MPQAIAYVGAYLFMSETAVTIGAFLMTYAAEIATVAMLVGGMAYSSMKERQAKEDARSQYNAAQVDRLVNVTSAVAPRELVMGRVRKGGAVFFKGSTGAYQKDLYLAIALAAHEIDAVERIYLNDVLVTLDGSGNVTDAPYSATSTLTGFGFTGSGFTATVPAGYIPGTISGIVYSGAGDGYSETAASVTVSGLTATSDLVGTYINYQYTQTDSHVKIVSHLGAAGQVVDSDLLANFPASWVSANTVQGVAYLLVKFTYSETAFPSGAANVTAVIRGARLYDPRSATTVWSENPALMLRHVYQHAKFGKATITAAEDARIIAAANACDTSTVYTVGGVAQSARPLYRASIVLPFGTAAKSAFDDLSQAMGGSWAFAGGSLYLKAGVYTASVMSLTDADLAVVQRNGASESQQPISISVHKQRAQKFNTVKVKIWDQAQDYKQVSLSPLVGAALLTRDGVELVQEVSFPAIGYAPQALHVAGVMMRDARDPLVVDLPFKLRAYPLELFDTVDLTLSRYGWTAKTFMILGRTWNANGSLQLTLKETTATITQVDAGFAAQGFSSNSNLPKPWIVGAVGPLTVTSGTAELLRQADGTIQSRMRVSWPQVVDAAVLQAGKIEVQYLRSNSSAGWQTLVASGDDTTIATTEVQDNMYYLVRARCRTSLAVGDWCQQVQHHLIGKTANPSDPTGFAAVTSEAGIMLSWAVPTDTDYAETVIKSGASWAAGTVIFTGSASNWLMARPATGAYSLWIKHVDSSGNQSANAVGLSFTYTSAHLITGLVQTTDLADNAATSVLIDVATTPIDNPREMYNATVRNIYDAGTYEVTLTCRVLCNSGTGLVYAGLIVGGAATCYGFQHVNENNMAAGATVDLICTITVVLTGAGPWSVTGFIGNDFYSSCSFYNTIVRSTFIKK